MIFPVNFIYYRHVNNNNVKTISKEKSHIVQTEHFLCYYQAQTSVIKLLSFKMDSEQDDRIEIEHQYRRNGDDEDEDDLDDPNKKDRSSHQSDSSDEASHDNMELNEKQQLQYQILQQAIKEEKSNPYQQQITSELIAKLNELASVGASKSGEDLVNIKIQQLALNKLLTLNYGKSDFRLVLAHYHLGEAYLTYECIEQAIEHIELALHKNEKLIDQLPKTRLLHISMQISLAQAFIVQNNYDDALDTLTKAENMEQIYNQDIGEGDGDGEKGGVHNIKILVLKGQCLCKQKNFNEALEVIDQVVSYTNSKQLSKIEYAFALVEKASIMSEIGSSQKYQKAIEHQQEAINILVNESYHKPEQVAQLYSTLSNYYEKINNSESALTCIQKVKTLYEEIFSPQDKRVIKARRKIATALLKSERYKEAVTELLQIAKLQEKIFGETAQLARTLKLLGTVYRSLGIGDAKVYLKRALSIFQATGNKKQVQDIKQKLKSMLSENQGGQMEANMISEQQI